MVRRKPEFGPIPDSDCQKVRTRSKMIVSYSFLWDTEEGLLVMHAARAGYLTRPALLY
jgi:hypothetical protein